MLLPLQQQDPSHFWMETSKQPLPSHGITGTPPLGAILVAQARAFGQPRRAPAPSPAVAPPAHHGTIRAEISATDLPRNPLGFCPIEVPGEAGSQLSFKALRVPHRRCKPLKSFVCLFSFGQESDKLTSNLKKKKIGNRSKQTSSIQHLQVFLCFSFFFSVS